MYSDNNNPSSSEEEDDEPQKGAETSQSPVS